MIYFIVAIFLVSSCVLLLAMCRTAKLFGDCEPELVLSHEAGLGWNSGQAAHDREEAA
jgi:hypothetical protein